MSAPTPLFTLVTGTPLGFLGFGFQEILLVAFVALLVFGGNLPDVMRQLGRTYAKLRQSLHELSQPVREEIRQLREVPPPSRRPTGYEDTSEDPKDIPPLEADAPPPDGSFDGDESGLDVLEEDERELRAQAPAITSTRPETEAPTVPTEIDEPPPV
jgi:sec-independent protein translocase protein TatA